MENGKLFHMEGVLWLKALSSNEVLIGETTDISSDSRTEGAAWDVAHDDWRKVT